MRGSLPFVTPDKLLDLNIEHQCLLTSKKSTNTTRHYVPPDGRIQKISMK